MLLKEEFSKAMSVKIHVMNISSLLFHKQQEFVLHVLRIVRHVLLLMTVIYVKNHSKYKEDKMDNQIHVSLLMFHVLLITVKLVMLLVMPVMNV